MKKNPHVYLYAMIMLSLACFLIMTPVVLIQGFLDICTCTMYAILILGGLSIGYISLLIIDKIEHNDKKELVAGLFIPLPTAMFMYFLVAMISKVSHELLVITHEKTGFLITNMFNTLPSAYAVMLTFLLSFEAVFLLHHHKKHKYEEMIVYYTVAVVLMAAAVIASNYFVSLL